MEKRNRRQRNGVELKELVYAPLHAVAEANMRLSSNIVDFLASTGDLGTDNAGNRTVNLHTIQMRYDQLRSDAEDNAVAERIGLEIPLLSIYPLSSLRVSKTKVAFDVEVKDTLPTDNGVKIFTQVCSKKQRDNAGQARFCFEVELESVPVSEGLSRFVDTLNTQAVPKRIHSRPLDGSGKTLTGKELEEYNKRMELVEREKNLNAKLGEVTELIRVKNNIISDKTGMSYDEYVSHLSYAETEIEDDEIAELCKAIKEYKDICTGIEEELIEIRKEKVAGQLQDGADDDAPDGGNNGGNGNNSNNNRGDDKNFRHRRGNNHGGRR